MKKSVMVIIFIIIFSLIIYPPVVGKAQTNPITYYATPYANIVETNATVIINTTFYELIINKHFNEPGALMARKGTSTGTLVNPTTAPAILLLIQDGTNIEKVNWTSYNVFNLSETRVGATLTAEGLGRQISLTLYFDAYKPYIDAELNIIGSPAKVYFLLPVNPNHADNWSQVVSYYRDNTLHVDATNESLYPLEGRLDSIALVGFTKNISVPTLILGYIEPPEALTNPIQVGVLSPETLPTNPLKELGNATGMLFSIVYEGAGTYVFKLAAVHYDPYEVLASNLDVAVGVVYPQAYSDFKEIIYSQELINQLNQTIQSLRERVDNLTKENQNLSKKLKQYEGCEAYWKNELKVKEQQMERLRDRIRQEGMISVTVFFVGVLLGAIGGYYVIGKEKKAKGVRRRR